jgi:hypothetical protein
MQIKKAREVFKFKIKDIVIEEWYLERLWKNLTRIN